MDLQVAENAFKAFVKSIEDACDGQPDKILIRPTSEGEYSIQAWPRGAREFEGAYCKSGK